MVEWCYPFKILDIYEFGSTFIKWFQLLYRHAEALVGLFHIILCLKGVLDRTPLALTSVVLPLTAATRRVTDFPRVPIGSEMQKSHVMCH